jgi:hypothetical protein
MGIDFQLEAGCKKGVFVHLDNLPLIPGRYKINLWLGSNNVPIDWIREGFLLVVMPGKINEKTVIVSKKYPVVLPSSWQESLLRSE